MFPAASRLWLPLLYLVTGIAWVVGSDIVLGDRVGLSSPALQLAGSAKGVVFVALSALLLYFVQRPRSTRHARTFSSRWARPVLIIATICAGLLTTGTIIYRQQAAELYARSTEVLNGAADQKTAQIDSWLNDRRSNLEHTGRNPLLAAAIADAIDHPDAGRIEVLSRTLDGMRLTEGFRHMQVFTPDGRPLAASAGGIAMTPRLNFWVRGAWLTGRVVTSDLYVPDQGGHRRPAIDFAVAVGDPQSGGRMVGVIVARSDLDDFLVPALAQWPAGAAAGAFALTRRAGNRVLVLAPRVTNGLGNDRLLYMPRSRVELPVVQVINGRQGIFESVEYQSNARVLVTGRPIAGTSWFLVGKINRDAMHAPLAKLGRLAVLLVLVTLVTSGALIGLWWRGERLRMALTLAELERQKSVLSEHFALAGRFVNDIVLLLEDGTARILEANDRALAAYGYSRDEILAMNFFDLWPRDPLHARLGRAHFGAVCDAGGGRFVTRHGARHGAEFPVEVSARVFRIDGRKFIQAIVHDVTERVEQEQRVAALSAERDRSLEQLQMQFNHMPTACVVISTDGRFVQVNPAFETLFGYAASQVLGRNVRDVIQMEEFREFALSRVEQLGTGTKEIYTGVHENVTLQGQPITCRWTVAALRNPDHTVSGLIAMAENITEQICAERALRTSEERYRALTEIAPVGIFRTDVDGQTVYANRPACAIAGITAAEALGLGWGKSVHPDDAPLMISDWQRYIGQPAATAWRQQYRILRPDGRETWVLTQATPERDGDGRLTGYIGTITDITALKVAQQELQKAHDHLEDRVHERTAELREAKDVAERSDRVKTAFLSTMSHELRTPLNSILGFTDVILEGFAGSLTDEQRRQLTIVRDSAAHLRSLIEDVLDITRIEAGQVGLDFTDVDMRDLCQRRIATFEAEATRKGIKLEFHSTGPVIAIRSDAKRAGQIVTNLLANAMKFTDAGRVSLELRGDAERIEIEVADTGIGISTDGLRMLFQPFTQVVRPGGRLHEGTGLGLAISRNLARALGGDIMATSEEGRGSRFTLWLPLAGDELAGASVTGAFPRFKVAEPAVAV